MLVAYGATSMPLKSRGFGALHSYVLF